MGRTEFSGEQMRIHFEERVCEKSIRLVKSEDKLGASI